MATHVGKEGLVTVGGNTIAELNGWDTTETAEPVEDTELSDEWKTFKSGTDIVKEWKSKINCMWDETDTNGQEAMTVGASVTLVFKAEGAGAGDTIGTGTGIVEEIGIKVERGATTEREFSIQGSGSLVWSNV